MPQFLLQQQTIVQPAQTILGALNQYFPSIPQQRILPPQITSLNARMEQLKQSHDGYCKSTLESSGIIDGIQSNHNYTRAISGGKRNDDIMPPPPSVSAGPSSRKRSALSDITNSSTDEPSDLQKQKRKKRGRKNDEEKAAHDSMLKFTLLDLIVDPECRSTWKYCNVNDILFMRGSLDQFIKSEKRLMHILCGTRRLLSDNIAEAT